MSTTTNQRKNNNQCATSLTSPVNLGYIKYFKGPLIKHTADGFHKGWQHGIQRASSTGQNIGVNRLNETNEILAHTPTEGQGHFQIKRYFSSIRCSKKLFRKMYGLF